MVLEVIPSLDLLKGSVVRLIRGDPRRVRIYSNAPMTMAQHWKGEGAELLHIVDLDAALGIGTNRAILLNLIRSSGMRCQVAGGIRTPQDAKALLEQGAERVVLGTLLFERPEALQDLLQEYGPDRLMAALDYEGDRVVVKGWRTTTTFGVLEAIERLLSLGFERFLLTCVDRDGTLMGPDLKVVEKASSLNKAKVVASGGIRSLDDLRALRDAGANGAILGRALYEGAISLREALKLALEGG